MAKEIVPHPIKNSDLLNMHEDRLWKLDAKPQKIYVAAPLTDQMDALRLALVLTDAGFKVTSRWIRRDFSTRLSDNEWKERVKLNELMCNIDLGDLEDSDTLVILANNPSTTGGYHCELGYFLGAKKTNIVVVGNRRNVFYWAEHVRWTHDSDELVEWLLDGSHGTVEVPLGRTLDDSAIVDGIEF